MALHHGVQVPVDKLGNADFQDIVSAVLRIMSEVGLKGTVVRGRTWQQLTALGTAYPVMAEQIGGNWVIIGGAVPSAENGMCVAVVDPRNEGGGAVVVGEEEFTANWTGRILMCKRWNRITDENQPFGFKWFMPEILRNGSHFRDVALAALMSALIAFATPLFFQILLDRVIPHQSYRTLFAVVIAFTITMLFDAAFSYIRQYLMIFASNKIDARLATRTFGHLLSLPMQFFERSTAGVLLRHMQQTEGIRAFLTGRLFQTLLDAIMMPLLLVVLAIYSGWLTLIVLCFSLAIAAVIGLMVPTFRGYLEQLYGAESSRQADLVETIQGMRTVKSLALEGNRMKSWDEKTVQSVRRRATVGYFSAVAVVITQFLQNMMQMTVLCIGAMLVFDGVLSMGALVAFNMLSNRVTGPLVQIVSLINEYQQTALSVKMLGHVMNHAPERDPKQRGIRPLITGSIEFSDVLFTYPGAVSPALNRVSFTVEEGQVIGVVGRSGSGKTTLTRMIQGIQVPQEGLIRLNGTDIRHIDLPHLRRSIGVVLQDNILFRGTIRENIAAGKPDATLDEVMEMARLAGADEFIDRLPMSYESPIEEASSNLSGGQRQRIAIARALMVRPRLLLFDEATSALDPESEAIVQQNLSEIARGRTMIIVSHRLSSLVNADAILVMDKGSVVDFAPHDVLLERCEIYAHLWGQQTSHLR